MPPRVAHAVPMPLPDGAINNSCNAIPTNNPAFAALAQFVAPLAPTVAVASAAVRSPPGASSVFAGPIADVVPRLWSRARVHAVELLRHRANPAAHPFPVVFLLAEKLQKEATAQMESRALELLHAHCCCFSTRDCLPHCAPHAARVHAG